MATTKVTLNSSTFSHENEAIKITGSLSVNGKNINSINGQVNEGENSLGSFDAYRAGDNLQFNLRPSSIGVAATLASAVADAVSAVEGKL